MSIRIVPKHPEERPDVQYRRVIRPDDPRTVEVLSEDGAFCPYCGEIQPFGKVNLLSWNRCHACRGFFDCVRIVTITYQTQGTLAANQEAPK